MTTLTTLNTIKDPSVWGKYYWYVMRSVATNADLLNTETTQNVVVFFESLQTLLPCEECASHYKNYMEKHPIRRFLKDNKTLLGWVKSLEDTITTGNKKKSTTYGIMPSSNVIINGVAKQPISLDEMKRRAKAYKDHMKIKDDLEAFDRALARKEIEENECCPGSDH